MSDFSFGGEHFNESAVYVSQSSRKVKEFNRWHRKFKDAMSSRSPSTVAAVKALNDKILRLKLLGPGSVHIDSALENMSVMFANPGMIGDRLMPFITVNKVSNRYFKYAQPDTFSFPDDVIGANGNANVVGYDQEQDSYSCVDHGLDGFVDVRTMQNADAPLDPIADETFYTQQGMAWNREKRIAAIVSNASNYGGNTLALNPGDEWNSANGGEPVANIQFAIDSMFEGRGDTLRVGFCSINVYRALSRHPQIRALYNSPTGGAAPGLVPREAIAKFFELDDLLVGRARQNTANKGQTATYSRIFPDVFGVLHVAMAPTIKSLCFGTSFRFKDSNEAAVRVKFYEEKGGAGAYQIIVRSCEDHKVVAPQAGFLITNCLAA